MRILGLFVVFVLSTGCCPSNNTPPPIYTPPEPQEASPVQAPPVASRGIDESRALDIAVELALEEGFDPNLYNEVVIESAGDDWIVQMRRPHILRFIEVHVDKRNGAAAFRVVSNNGR